jgi:prophage maintenance system killer protein
MLMVFITKGHCFVDGNKRNALAAAVTFLKINECTGRADNQEVYNRTVEIACAKFINDSIDEYIFKLAYWLKKDFTKRWSRTDSFLFSIGTGYSRLSNFC